MVQGLKERKSHFNMLVFFSLNQGERLLAFTALCRAKELKKTPELGQRAVSRLFSLWVFTFGCVVGMGEPSQQEGTLLAALRNDLRFGLQR